MRIAGVDFELMGEIVPDRRSDGAIAEHAPQDRYKNAERARLHAYGGGPFCRFRIARDRHEPGLYVLTCDGAPTYIGECQDLSKRWGPNGYGSISPRNCFVGGQQTNCRINHLILEEARSGRALELWFASRPDDKAARLALETDLIRTGRPAWNLAKKQ